MKPTPGRVVVRPIATADTLNGGRIVLTENVRQTWTLGQAEVVLVGEADKCEDEDCERDHHYLFPHYDTMEKTHSLDARLKPGAWVLCKPRRFVELPDGNWLVNALDIVGVFQ